MSRKTEARKRVENAWVSVLASEQGRIVLAELIRTNGLLSSSFVSGDPLASAHAEGRRSVAIMIYTETTLVGQGAFLTALMAEVMQPPDVRNDRRRTEPDDDAEPGERG